MNVCVGCQVVAPEGLGSLVKGKGYFFLGNVGRSATLAWFDNIESSEKRRACIIRLPSTTFEDALLDGGLVVTEKFHSMPPWLRDLEGLAHEDIERHSKDAKTSDREIVDRRYSFIHGLVKTHIQLLTRGDLIASIGTHARACNPPQNATRLAVWLIGYLITGNNMWSLLPAYSAIGKWERSAHKYGDKKLGRPSQYAGKRSGYSAIPLAEKIQNAYLKHSGLGIKMTEIYRAALKRDFNCLEDESDPDNPYFYHPEGEPFPSNRQFSYWVKKKFGLARIQLIRYGHPRVRQKSKTSQGKYSEAYSNVLEAMEADGHHCKERPRCVMTSEPAPPLIIARAADPLTSRGYGLGASIVGESTETYRLMLFTMCIKASVMRRLFDLDPEQLSDDDWPGEGLAHDCNLDRGPGASKHLIEDLERKFPITGLAPSYQPQSKATVESTHPRRDQLNGAPTYIQSDLTTSQMYKRELLRMVRDNRTRDISDRMTPKMIADRVPANPKAVWEYLVAGGRNNAKPVDFATAVRAFLRPVEFTVKADGVYLEGNRFDSAEMRETRFSQRLSSKQQATIRGYVFPLSLCIAWIEVSNRLVEVEFTLPIRDGKYQKYVSYSELQQLAQARRELQGQQRERAQAAAAVAESRFAQHTGNRWNGGKRVGGSAPNASTAARKESDITAKSRTRRAS